MDFPQTHHTNTGRPVRIDRQADGSLTFSSGPTELARLIPEANGWRITLGRDEKSLETYADEPPITPAMVQIDLHYDEDDDASGIGD